MNIYNLIGVAQLIERNFMYFDMNYMFDLNYVHLNNDARVVNNHPGDRFTGDGCVASFGLLMLMRDLSTDERQKLKTEYNQFEDNIWNECFYPRAKEYFELTDEQASELFETSVHPNSDGIENDRKYFDTQREYASAAAQRIIDFIFLKGDAEQRIYLQEDEYAKQFLTKYFPESA